MSTLRERIETKLHERICSVCIKTLADGHCGLPPSYPCPLFQHLDDVIAVVAGMDGDSIDPYIARLREIVCTGCRLEENGTCGRPGDLECALDMYFPLVIDLIEAELASVRKATG